MKINICMVFSDTTWSYGSDDPKNFGLPWKPIPEDIEFLKQKCDEHDVILVTTKSYKSLPDSFKNQFKGKFILLGSESVDGIEAYYFPKITRGLVEDVITGIGIMDPASQLFESIPKHAIFIGGGSLFKQMYAICDTAYITQVEEDLVSTLSDNNYSCGYTVDVGHHVGAGYWENGTEFKPLVEDDLKFKYKRTTRVVEGVCKFVEYVR